jgi:uracil-DNA glycosylase family 4
MSHTVAELQLIAEQVSSCTLCRLCESRTNAVPGSGSFTAEIVFIGEGPGKTEDERGIPFCGASGRLLDQLLGTISLSRDDVFITNVVKCRPPANRDPLPDEKTTCATAYLDRQLELIDPKLVVTLGRHALGHFIPDLKISEVHGQPKRFRGRTYLALYHPAVALYNAGMRETLFNDFLNIPRTLRALAHQETGSI